MRSHRNSVLAGMAVASLATVGGGQVLVVDDTVSPDRRVRDTLRGDGRFLPRSARTPIASDQERLRQAELKRARKGEKLRRLLSSVEG